MASVALSLHYCITYYVKGNVPGVYIAGNCYNVVLAFPLRWGLGACNRNSYNVRALIGEVGTTRHRGMLLEYCAFMLSVCSGMSYVIRVFVDTVGYKLLLSCRIICDTDV